MRNKISLAVLLPFFLLVHLCLTAVAGQKILEDIDFESLSGGRERITFKLNGPNIPRIFAIKGENPRVVFDFIDTKAARVLKNTINTNGKFITRIRLGFHTQPVLKTRVVFDLTTDSEVGFDHDFNADNNCLIITVFHQGEKSSTVKPDQVNRKTPPPAGKSQPARKAEQTTPQLSPSTPPPQETTVQKPLEKKTVAPAPEKAVSESVKDVVAEKKSETGKKTRPVQAKTEEPRKERNGTQNLSHLESTSSSGKKTFRKTASSRKKVPEIKEKSEEKTVAPAAEKTPEAAEKPSASGIAKKLPLPDGLALLNNVTFDNSSNRGEMVLFKLTTFYPPLIFGKETGHPQVICEFKRTAAAKELPAVIRTDGKYVRKIRINTSKATDKVQAVIDLTPGSSYDLQQVFFKEDNLFVIIVNPLSGKKK
jgi:hypothetical protein